MNKKQRYIILRNKGREKCNNTIIINFKLQKYSKIFNKQNKEKEQ